MQIYDVLTFCACRSWLYFKTRLAVTVRPAVAYYKFTTDVAGERTSWKLRLILFWWNY